MAAKKKASKKRVATRKSSVPANWRDELLERAQEQADRVPAGTGNSITLKKNGQFHFQGSSLGDALDVVIVDYVFVKKWFDSDYDEDNPTPPACFALKATDKDIAPHEDSPNLQAEACEDCWANEFGSHESRKRAKACADRFRLALLHGEDISETSDLITMEVPVTSRKAFSAYVSKVTKAAQVPTFAVLSRITMDEDADYQTLVFELVDELPDKLSMVTSGRVDEARDLLLKPYDTSSYAAPKGAKKASKKKVSKKKRPTAKKRRSRSRLG